MLWVMLWLPLKMPRLKPIQTASARKAEAATSSRSLRLDRTVSIHLIRPLLQILNGRRAPGIPILMYHGFRAGIGMGHPYFETATAPVVFETHMQFLAEHGYKTLTLPAVGARLEGGLQDKYVAITFDDGYLDFYTHALPILQKHGFKATVFIVSGFAGEQARGSNGNSFMSWSQIREIQSQGMEIGSHTVTHPQLHAMPSKQVEKEVSESKRAIEEKVGAAVTSFAYPYAFPEQDRQFAKGLRESLKQQGYESAVSTIIGTARRGNDAFFLPRIPVNSYDDLRFFDVKLNRGYDWLHSLQYLRKCANFHHVQQ